MLALQRVTGLLGVVKLPHFPRVRRMTLTAVVSQRAAVFVVAQVATHALIVRQRKLIADVAAVTRHDLMHADQRKFGKVVIKLIDGLPAIRAVAGRAQTHAGIFVDVVGRVAGCTIPRQIVVNAADVALRAGEIGVVAGQREIGIALVIELYLLPAAGVVAIFTVVAIAAEVDIVVAVARVALQRRGAGLVSLLVARAARKVLMFSM